MKTIAILLTLCAGCLDDGAPDPAPDSVEAPADPCCGYLPDESAVQVCVATTEPLPPWTCGVIACRNADGGHTKINVCGPRP